MASLYLLTALSCAVVAWQPYRRTDLWDWLCAAARTERYRKGDEATEEITRYVMMLLFGVPAFLTLLASAYLFSHRAL